MITKIGIVAGEIWAFLDKSEQVDLEHLASGIERPREVILMSLGWLAREGHVLVELNDGQYKFSLRKINKQ